MQELNYLQRFFGHLKTINRHRYLVMTTCFKCGMYKQGLLHDLSKYSPEEFFSSVKYFQGFRSPIGKEKEVLGYSNCYLHHKGRNKHHWEYWIDRKPKSIELYVFPMPYRYMLESVIDRISASKTYKKNEYTDEEPYNFFINSKERSVMNPKTADQLEELLLYLKENGEEKALKYYKSLYKQNKNLL
ncbi:MAG: catalase [Erysipelotrichaceae bacterium]|nr:catalase [Erysipelotrichaceae bacterium]MBP5279695.1 catalase [Erysipelotrichaceae bacterium]